MTCLTIRPRRFDILRPSFAPPKRCAATRSAALDLCYLAMGRFDGFWELGLKPWDMAAGILVIAEAGGQVTNFTSENYSIYQNQILASNGLIHAQMRAVMERSTETRTAV